MADEGYCGWCGQKTKVHHQKTLSDMIEGMVESIEYLEKTVEKVEEDVADIISRLDDVECVIDE